MPKKKAAHHELQVGRRLASANLSHKDTLYLQIVIEGFEVTGPNGMYICSVFEPIREGLSLFQSRLKQKKFPLELMKMYLVCLLNSLDYLHSDCHAIHAGELGSFSRARLPELTPFLLDLSLQNILVSFEDDSVLEEIHMSWLRLWIVINAA
jgi:serine/threonine protein kinase